MEQEENLNSKELTVIVLGGIESGKTTLIWSLLGQTDIQQRQRTANCIRHDGQFSNRKLTVVDTPGWYKGYPLMDTAQRTKDELVLSVKQCPSGPHAFILAIEVASLIERNLESVLEHLGLFGDDIWRHTIVVFTRGDSLEGKTIEQHIDNEGKVLKWLVEKCGNRYCVFDKQTTGQDQLTELLGVIDRLVDNNRGRPFQMNEETLREVDERKRDAQQRARVRQLQVQEKRNYLREQCTGVIPSLPEVRMVLLGWVMSGKTSARNVILNKDIGASLRKTERCERESGSVGGRQITVVDTPGWWKYFPSQYTPESVEAELKKSVSLGSKSPHALLLVVPAGVSFLEEQRKITEDNMKMMFGKMAPMVWRHTIVLFNLWGSLGNTSIEEHIESEGEPLRWLLEKCANRYHIFDVNRGDGSQVSELLEKIDELEASLDFCDQSQEGPNTEITPSYKEEDQLKPEMLKLVGKEWSRRDKELEERVKRFWHEMFGSAARGDRSMDCVTNFHDNDVSSENGAEKRLPVDLTQTKSSDLNITSVDFQHHHGLPHPHQSALNVKMSGTFEREWGRCKAISADRIRGILFHEVHKHSSRELEAWHRHEAVVMERVQTMISELCSHSVFPSEPDDEEFKQAERKVLMWSIHTSGRGSESDPEDTGMGDSNPE